MSNKITLVRSRPLYLGVELLCKTCWMLDPKSYHWKKELPLSSESDRYDSSSSISRSLDFKVANVQLWLFRSFFILDMAAEFLIDFLDLLLSSFSFFLDLKHLAAGFLSPLGKWGAGFPVGSLPNGYIRSVPLPMIQVPGRRIDNNPAYSRVPAM